MRTGDCRCPFGLSALGLDLPPFPIAATLSTTTGLWTVTFDKALQPGVLDFTNWFFRAANTAWLGDFATAAGAVVAGTATQGLEDLGPDVVNFTPPPFDVLSLTGLPAVAFADFPLVVT